jgi:hypothetical protein
LRKLCDSSGARLSRAWNWLTGVTRGRPATADADQHSTDAPPADQPSDAWTRYCHEADTCPRFVRVFAWAAVYSVISFCLIRIWPVTASFRGSFSYTVNGWLITLCVMAFNLLLFYVFDALYICNRCIKRLTSGKPQWSPETYEKFRGGAHLENEHLDHWIAVHMIGRRTEAVGPLIYMPFLLLFLIILARNSVFEHWALVPSVLGYWTMSAGLLVYAALSLRMTTEAERSKATETLAAQLLVAKGGTNAGLVAQLQMMLDELNGYRQGAFASYADQHFIRALLLPLAGVAGSLLINYLSIVKP